MKLSDTSDAAKHLPLYTYDSVDQLTLPKGCALVGVELTEGFMMDPEASVSALAFHHPDARCFSVGETDEA